MGYGEWVSPITLDVVTSSAEEISDAVVDPISGELFWRVKKPSGQYVIRSGDPEVAVKEWTPEGFSSCSMVNEYGFGDFFPHDNTLYFVNYTDQRLYRQREPQATPAPITTGEYGDKILRYSGGHYCSFLKMIIMVREDHRRTGELCVQTVVAIDPETSTQTILAEGADFYRGARTHGDQLVFASWFLPNMPWDTTHISMGTLVLGADGVPAVEGLNVVKSTGSNLQAVPISDEAFLYLSDSTGYWNVWSSQDDSGPIFKVDKDSGFPYGWIAGHPGFGICGEGVVIAAKDTLSLMHPDKKNTVKKDLASWVREAGFRFGTFANVQCFEDTIFVIGLEDSSRVATLLRISLSEESVRAFNDSLAPEHLQKYISFPETLTFPTSDNMECFGYLFRPVNPDYPTPSSTDEKPPLLVKIHGGPTGMTTNSLDYKTQYFTSRGFAVIMLDYRGSNGLGRDYRKSLYGKWGIYDLDDAIAAAEYLVQQGWVDPEKLAISGGSAGGYTTMAMMTFRDYFKAGVSYYGVSDLEALCGPLGHKFESRYPDQLVGKYPEDLAIYKARSPIYHAEQLTGAIGFFQGSVDKICPPPQSIPLYDAAVSNGIPTFYVEYEGEGHGFRKAPNIQRCLSNELYFYSRIFKFEPADKTENPPPIVNL